MEFEKIQHKLLFDVIPTFTKNIHLCKIKQDLVHNAKLFMESIRMCVFPDKILKLTPLKTAHNGSSATGIIVAASQEFSKYQAAVDKLNASLKDYIQSLS